MLYFSYSFISKNYIDLLSNENNFLINSINDLKFHSWSDKIIFCILNYAFVLSILLGKNLKLIQKQYFQLYKFKSIGNKIKVNYGDFEKKYMLVELNNIEYLEKNDFDDIHHEPKSKILYYLLQIPFISYISVVIFALLITLLKIYLNKLNFKSFGKYFITNIFLYFIFSLLFLFPNFISQNFEIETITKEEIKIINQKIKKIKKNENQLILQNTIFENEKNLYFLFAIFIFIPIFSNYILKNMKLIYISSFVIFISFILLLIYSFKKFKIQLSTELIKEMRKINQNSFENLYIPEDQLRFFQEFE